MIFAVLDVSLIKLLRFVVLIL